MEDFDLLDLDAMGPSVVCIAGKEYRELGQFQVNSPTMAVFEAMVARNVWDIQFTNTWTDTKTKVIHPCCDGNRTVCVHTTQRRTMQEFWEEYWRIAQEEGIEGAR